MESRSRGVQLKFAFRFDHRKTPECEGLAARPSKRLSIVTLAPSERRNFRVIDACESRCPNCAR